MVDLLQRDAGRYDHLFHRSRVSKRHSGVVVERFDQHAATAVSQPGENERARIVGRQQASLDPDSSRKE